MRSYQSLPAKATVTILGEEFTVQPIDINTVMISSERWNGAIRDSSVQFRGNAYRIGGNFERDETGEWRATRYSEIGLNGTFGSRPCSDKVHLVLVGLTNDALKQWHTDNPTHLLEAQIAQEHNQARSIEDDIERIDAKRAELSSTLADTNARITGYKLALEAAPEVINA